MFVCVCHIVSCVEICHCRRAAVAAKWLAGGGRPDAFAAWDLCEPLPKVLLHFKFTKAHRPHAPSMRMMRLHHLVAPTLGSWIKVLPIKTDCVSVEYQAEHTAWLAMKRASD
jgi:hypothetical protein